MKTFILALFLVSSVAFSNNQPARPPMHGPTRSTTPHVQHAPGVRPHVEGNRWVGHATPEHFRPSITNRYHGGFGPRHTYRLHGGGRERFFCDRFFFRVAVFDYPFCDDWSWDNDQVVVYEDPDHEGMYVAYNVRLGTYVHVEYLGY